MKCEDGEDEDDAAADDGDDDDGADDSFFMAVARKSRVIHYLHGSYGHSWHHTAAGLGLPVPTLAPATVLG